MSDALTQTCPHCGGTGTIRQTWGNLAPAWQALLLAMKDGPQVAGALPMSTGHESARAQQLRYLIARGLVERLIITGQRGYTYRLTATGRMLVQEGATTP